MQAYDIVMLVVLLGAAAWGFMKGLAWQLASIASLVVSYFVAMGCRGMLAPALPGEPPLNNVLAMLILFVVTSAAVWIGFRFVSETIEKVKLKAFDHQVGALFGFGKGVLYCVVITLFAATLLQNQREAIVKSKSGHYISILLTKADPLLPDGVRDAIDPYIEDFETGRPPANMKSPEEFAEKLFDTATSATQDQITKKFEGFGNQLQDAVKQTAGDVQNKFDGAVNQARDSAVKRTRDTFDDDNADLEMVDVVPTTRKR